MCRVMFRICTGAISTDGPCSCANLHMRCVGGWVGRCVCGWVGGREIEIERALFREGEWEGERHREGGRRERGSEGGSE